ncbi:hypothetical protein DPMN_027279 [Dreissena polymorpha]|uniref:Uncharacterized protein n=1 Tax=Dreissena polymorpha TaxID=45954 RepID=A0A9D4LT68_DREPO|nr:hypothetical protein DPMN_027279 [Dreissena polymorpha]
MLILLNGQMGDFLMMSLDDRQRYPLSPVLFNLNLEKIMKEAIQDQYSSSSFAGPSLLEYR